MNILGIETSCDETAAAVVRDGVEILSNVVSSQVDLHRPYGGVVPELAARHHLERIEEIVAQALTDAGVTWPQVGAVAATAEPGLASSLLIGLNTGKGIAAALGVPFIPVNHLEAHLYSPLIANASWPVVALIVSGGHTLLVHATAMGRHEILGQTMDDAAGEAFDKVAKLLRLGYPGGPEIDRLARQGNAAAIPFPRSLRDERGFQFSFSGLKTAVRYYLEQHPDAPVADVCASFQEAVVDVLVAKTLRAAAATGARTVALAGGVSINSRLRQRLREECARDGIRLLLADARLCTDNAGMIAALAFHKLPTGPETFAAAVSPSVGLR